MFKLLKYLPALLKFQQVSKVYKDAEGKDKPFYVSRRFVGSIIALIGTVATLYFGVDIGNETVMQITDSFVTMFTALGTIFGLVMGIIGVIGAKK